MAGRGRWFWIMVMMLLTLVSASLLPYSTSSSGEPVSGFVVDGITINSMQLLMFGTSQGDEILWSVVVPNTVDVMHMQVPLQQFSARLFPDQSMLQHVPIFGNVGVIRSIDQHVAILPLALWLWAGVGMWLALSQMPVMAGNKRAWVPSEIAQFARRFGRNRCSLTTTTLTQAGRNQARIWRDLARRRLSEQMVTRQIALLLVPAFAVIRQCLSTSTCAQSIDWGFGFWRAVSPAVCSPPIDNLSAAALA